MRRMMNAACAVALLLWSGVAVAQTGPAAWVYGTPEAASGQLGVRQLSLPYLSSVTGTSGNKIPLLDGTNTWSGRQTFSGASSAAPAASGTTQSGSPLRVAPTGANNVLDIGANNTGATYAWLQSTDLSSLATNYALLLNPNGGAVGINQTTVPATNFAVKGNAAFTGRTFTSYSVSNPDTDGLWVSSVPDITYQSFAGGSPGTYFTSQLIQFTSTLGADYSQTGLTVNFRNYSGGGGTVTAMAGIQNVGLAGIGGGKHWTQANNAIFETGWNDVFGVNTEFDITNVAVDATPVTGTSNLFNLFLSGQPTITPVTAEIYIGSTPTGTPSAFHSHWGIAFTGAETIKTYTFVDSTSSATSIYIAGTHTNGIDLSAATTSGKQINATGFSVDPDGDTAVKTLTVAAGADTSAVINRNTTYNTYNSIALNGNLVASSLIGLMGGATGDGNLYYFAGGSAGHVWRIADTQYMALSTTNLTVPAVNKVTITAPATSAVLTIADGKTLTASNTLTFTGTDSSSVAFGAGGTVAYTSNKLSAFAATTSAELAGVISDETGSGPLVFGTSPTITTGMTINTGADRNILVGQWGGSTAFNAISLNNSLVAATQIGLFGGGTSDENMYYAAGSGHVWRIANAAVMQFNTIGMNFLTGTAIPAGGTAGMGITFSSTSNFGIFFGSGAPSLSAAKGSIYIRSDGSGTGDRTYINTNGSTTWTAITTAS